MGTLRKIKIRSAENTSSEELSNEENENTGKN